MNLREAIEPSLIQFDLQAKNQKEAVQKIADLMAANDLLSDLEQYLADVQTREQGGTTGIGMGIAIPHARSSGVKKTCFSLVKLEQPLDWNSLDGEPVTYVIMLAVPEGENSEFLQLLSTLAENLMNDDFREGLKKAKTVEEVFDVFN